MSVYAAPELAGSVRLVGECNRCGLCCQGTTPEGLRWICEHLAYDPHALMGAPWATFCRVYAERVDGMAITLRVEDGTRVEGVCRKDSVEETALILHHIGQGCSLQVAPREE